MREFLLFRLYGALAAWGDIAVGKRRGSWSRPSKSAVLGLVAAALGIERKEEERYAALAAGYGFAVRVDAPGVPLGDFHTAQTVREVGINVLRETEPRPLTRQRELSVERRETILSRRLYYADALYTAALWVRKCAPESLDCLRRALLTPRFALCLGRKSCPPSLPLAPEVAAAADLLDALVAYRPPEPEGLPGPLSSILNSRNAPALLAWEDAIIAPTRLRALHFERRRDTPGDRSRWQFFERDEQVAILP